MLKTINEEAVSSGEASKTTLSKLAKALNKGRECSIQEAIYRLIGLPMTKFSSVVRFINSNHPDRRVGLVKSEVELAGLGDDEDPCMNSIHNYYEARPDGLDWDNMSLAQFVSSYNIVKNKSTREDRKQNLIHLKHKKGYLVRRTSDCVIRYFLRYDNDEERYRGLCVLFLPFRNERRDIHNKDVQTLYNQPQNKKKIEDEQSKFEKYCRLVALIEENEKEKDRDDDFEEDEEPENIFVEDETTRPDEKADFDKYAQNQAKKEIARYNQGIETMTETKFLEQVNMLNEQQRKMFDDFVERIYAGTEDTPFYLYIGGEAGTGKSFLLKLMIEAVKLLGKASGRELDKPVTITLAPTGVAAYLVNGTTIESGLGLMPQKRKNYTGNSAAKNSSLRFTYSELKVIFLDEVSMCGSDMLTRMDIRMQEIMGISKFMGGVSLVCTGDFGQLPPVGQSIIWNTSFLDNRLEISPNHWDENFKIYYLNEKMRSQHDEEFSEICDLVRKGTCNEKVIDYMNKHVRSCTNENDNEAYKTGRLSIIVTSNVDRHRINNEKLEKLLPDKKLFIVKANRKSKHQNPPPLRKNLTLSQTGQLETQFGVKEGCPVMITSNYREQRFKNNGLVNGARGYVSSIQPSREDVDMPEIIWVCFNNDKVGQLLRQEKMNLVKAWEAHVNLDSKAVPILKMKKMFQGDKEMYENFRLTPCYAITSHKEEF